MKPPSLMAPARRAAPHHALGSLLTETGREDVGKFYDELAEKGVESAGQLPTVNC